MNDFTTAELEPLLKELGLGIAQELMSRRGQALYVLRSDVGREQILKVARKSAHVAGTDYDPAEVLRNEISVYGNLNRNRYEYFVSGGENQNAVWLLLNRLQGESLGSFAKQLREADSCSPETRTTFYSLISKSLSSLLEFQDAGYLHADIQPAHFLVCDNHESVKLIDFGLSFKVTTGLPFQYRGAMVHFNAPEVCRALLGDPGAGVEYTPTSEVYSFAATCFYIYTGECPIFYGQTMPDFHAILEKIATGHIRAIQAPVHLQSKAFEDLLREALANNPQQRIQSLHVFRKQLELLIEDEK